MKSFALVVTWAAIFAQLLPVLPVAPAWNRVPVVRRWVALWSVAYFLSDIAQYVAVRLQGNNLWLLTYVNPIEDAVVLWALSYWQVKPVSRITFRVGIPIFVLAYLGLVIAVGELTTFQTIAGTFRSAVLLVAALFTFLSNLAKDTEGAFNQDWSWASLGLAMYFGVLVSTSPVASLVGADNIAVLRAVFTVKAMLDIVAFALIWQGMRCPLPNSFSGSTSR